MAKQISDLAEINEVRVIGISDTNDRRVTELQLIAPMVRYSDDMKSPIGGLLTARQAIALGHLLQQYGEGMLEGSLKFDANTSKLRDPDWWMIRR